MKRTVVLLAATGMILALFAGVALAKTINGNNRDNVLFGTERADTIRGFGGEDVIFGLDGGGITQRWRTVFPYATATSSIVACS